MELAGERACVSLRHAPGGRDRVLDRLADERVDQPPDGCGTNRERR